MAKAPKQSNAAGSDLERMNEALKAALQTPPRKHKEEPRRRPRKGNTTDDRG